MIFRIFLVFASAALFNLSQPGYDLFFLAFFFTVPLHIASKGLSPRKSFLLYYFSGFISWTWLLSWIPDNVKYFSHFSGEMRAKKSGSSPASQYVILEPKGFKRKELP
jgi:apolipoprotein N-acyltransferase